MNTSRKKQALSHCRHHGCSMTPDDTDTSPPDTWPETAQLILLAFNDDPHIAHLAGRELLARLPSLPAIPLALDDGQRKVIRWAATS